MAEQQRCNCGAVTVDSEEDALQIVTGVGIKIWRHYFGRVGTPTPCGPTVVAPAR